MDQIGIIPYKNSLDHILDEIKLVELYLGLAVIQYRKNLKEKKSQNGLEPESNVYDEFNLESKYISSNSQHNSYQKLQSTIINYSNKIKQRKKSSLQKNIQLSLEQLCNSFALSEFEKSVITFCLANEIDTKFEKLYSYLQNDTTKRQPTVGLFLELLCNTKQEQLSNKRYFVNDSLLVKYRIIELDDNPIYLSKSLKLNFDVLDFLLGHNQWNVRFQAFSYMLMPKNIKNNSELELFAEIREKLFFAIKNNLQYNSQSLYYVVGEQGIGRKTLVKSICHELNYPLFVIDIQKLVNSDNNLDEVISYIFRNAMLYKAILYFDNFDTLFENANDEEPFKKTKRTLLILLLKTISKYDKICFLAGKDSWNRQLNNSVNIIEFSMLSFEQRKKIWSFLLENKFADNSILESLADKFRFTPNQINQAIAVAQNNSENKKTISITRDGLYNGCLSQCNTNLEKLAKKVSKKYFIDDIIISNDKKQQIHEIISFVKYRHKVFSDWGFDKKIATSSGINILFAGDSGTGKTMTASIIANELKLDLYRIDLSSVVSKYIGETEKNLDKIFKEAQTSNAILFFDEADALFGKRTDIKDSHDRYANIEVSYLLQKLEEHQEIVILASNFARNIDDAFLRRMQFWIEFEFPSENQRLEIWKNIFPKDAPLSEDIDFEFLARNFIITGGNIRNIALTSAFYSATLDGLGITMQHILSAIKREYQKIGKPIHNNDFEKT